MNKNKNISGFTLIELIIVISIISILLIFSFPVFKDIGLFSDSQSHVGEIIRLINNLKKRAVGQQVDFQMHIDPGARVVWVTSDAMDDEAKKLAKQSSVSLSGNFIILDVEFPGIKSAGSDEYQIRFRKQGYSDFALIHIMDDEDKITLRIEPFLSQVEVLKGHAYLDDCI